jgi:hypothetical protein
MTNSVRSYKITIYKIVIMCFFVVFLDGISYSQNDAHIGTVHKIAARENIMLQKRD